MHAHWGRPSTHAGYYFLGFRSLGTVLQNTDDELHMCTSQSIVSGYLICLWLESTPPVDSLPVM